MYFGTFDNGNRCALIVGLLSLIPQKIRQKVNASGRGATRSGRRGRRAVAAAADYPLIRHKNNFLIYEESWRGGYWAPRYLTAY